MALDLSKVILVLAGAIATPLGRVGSLAIDDALNDTPNTLTLTLNADLHTSALDSGPFLASAFDAGAFNSAAAPFVIPAPQTGQSIEVYLGSTDPGSRLYAGQILTTQQYYEVQTPRLVAYHITATDHVRRLNRRQVLKAYGQQSATAIVLDLMATFTSGFTTDHVAPDLPIVEGGMAFTFEDMAGALSRVANKIGGYWYLDYDRDLHFYLEETSDNPTPLTVGADFADLTIAIDRARLKSRVYVEGGGSVTPTLIPIGETILPIDDATWYNAAGGTVVTVQQRLTYAGTVPGGGGALVGQGASPGAAPTVAAAPGAGMDPGVHGYAVTFQTAAGESLPGPVATVTTGLMTPPGAPTVDAAAGTGLSVGTYQYAVSFVTASGETIPGATRSHSIAQDVFAPTIAPDPDPAPYDEGSLDSGANYQYRWAWSTATAFDDYSQVTPPGPASLPTKPGPNRSMDVFNWPTTTNPAVKWVFGYRTEGNGSVFKLWTWQSYGTVGHPPYPEPYQDDHGDSWLSGRPTPNSTNTTVPGYAQVALSNLPIGPAGTTARKIWRTAANGAQLKLVTTIANNTATTYTDSTPDGSLGANAPTVTTASANQVALTQIPIGASGVTGRTLYRTAANSATLQLLTTIANNTATTYTDAAADATLGASVPVTDTSGLKQSEGQVNAGATTMPVAGTSAFSPTGGWAIIGNGEQVVRYTGLTPGAALTGIPASGAGAITATVNFNSTVTAAPALIGIPASGPGAIVQAIPRGEDVNLLTQSDDPAAQAAIAAIEGGDGIIEHYVQDRRLSEASARARGAAELELFKQPITIVRYTTRDRRTRSGKTILIDLPAPTSLQGEFLIQSVKMSQVQIAAGLDPLRTVEASSSRLSFEEVLRALTLELA